MATNINVQLVGGSLQVVDNTANVYRVNSTIASLIAQATVAYYDPYVSVPTASTALALPSTTIWVLYIRNISASNTISIALTPTGGSAWSSPYVIAPTGVFCTIVSYTSAPSVGGFTAASWSASAASTYAEILLAA